MRSSNIFLLMAWCAFLLPASWARAAEAVDYESDPDPNRYSLHVQPPLHDAALARPVTSDIRVEVSGIQLIDVYTAAGFDIAGGDRGNEPSIAANPRNPNQIVIMSFTGSAWGSGGNGTLLYSADGGLTWSRPISIPPPTGVTTNINCPCDQTPDWGRNGLFYATFLHYSTGGSVASVYSAQSTAPNVAGAWTYRTNAGVAQKTNDPALIYVDQPWLWSGPLDIDNGLSNVCVAYDNFDVNYINVQTRSADSPGFSPLNFTRDAVTNIDGQQYNDSINPGNRLAAGPTGILFNLYQRLVSIQGGGVKQITYLVTASTNAGQSWSVANSDHATGAKIVRANALSFQGNGSKVGGVNALLGGVTAINVDPASGTAWVVYGERATLGSTDQLFLVPVTYSSGSLIVGTARQISPAGLNSYLPAVSVLPSGEVGVLFLTYDGAGSYTWRFVQTIDGGMTLSKNTTLTTFTSPFVDNGASNQRIFGDYVQVKAVGCEFFGTFGARGSGVNSVNSIDPYFMRAPAATSCTPPVLSTLSPSAACAGGGSFGLTLGGSHFLNGATALVQGANRTTAYVSGSQVSTTIGAADILNPGSLSIQLLNASPAGGLTGTLLLPIDAAPPASPGASLVVIKGGGNVSLSWSAAAGAGYYNVKRCNATTGPCSPVTIITEPTNAHSEATLGDGNSYWYLIESANGCGSVG